MFQLQNKNKKRRALKAMYEILLTPFENKYPQ